jgi:hypothetical protein
MDHRVSGLSSAKSAPLDTGTWDMTTQKIISYNWNIQNFSSWSPSAGECLESPVFPANDSLQWRLQIYLGEKEGADLVFLNLQLVSSQSQKPDAKVKLAFVDRRGQLTELGSSPLYYKSKKGWGYVNFVCRSLLLTSDFELSSKDSLTVACEVTVQTQTCSLHQEPAHHLKDQCIEFINRNSSDVVKTELWAAMVETHPHLAAEIYVRLVAM